MPTFDVKTVESKVVWQKGDRTISEVLLDHAGQKVQAKTYSAAIAKVGFEGEVETYEKDGRNGTETFVKQAPKEDSRPSGGGRSNGGGGGKPQDPFTMYLSYAKDLVVALTQTTGFTKEAYEVLLAATIKGGKALYNNRPDAEGTPTATAVPVKTEDTVYEPTDSDMEQLSAVFGDVEEYTVDGEKEAPWTPPEKK